MKWTEKIKGVWNKLFHVEQSVPPTPVPSAPEPRPEEPEELGFWEKLAKKTGLTEKQTKVMAQSTRGKSELGLVEGGEDSSGHYQSRHDLRCLEIIRDIPRKFSAISSLPTFPKRRR